jgi:putative component of toxin-antitoxin plasmid stabilization module
MKTVRRYMRENGHIPFDEWLHSLKNQLLQAHVLQTSDVQKAKRYWKDWKRRQR